VSITAEFKALNRPEKLSTVFYLISGIFLLAMLPFSSFAPHLALIGVFSLFTGAVVLVKNGWLTWFVAVQFVTVLVFSLWTIFALGSANWLVTAVLAVYVALDVVATLCFTIWRKNFGF
jgi:hypothetical protein